MDIQSVITLINAVSAADITNFQIEEGNFRLKIDKLNQNTDNGILSIQSSGNQMNTNNMSSIFGNHQVGVHPSVNEVQNFSVQQPMQTIQPVVSSIPPANPVAPTLEATGDANIQEVKSPIVGTFYSASGPDAADFATVGDMVKKGQTLCIIEAMKLMNEIECDFTGEIVEVLVKNEQMVEFNQPLFKIRVDG